MLLCYRVILTFEQYLVGFFLLFFFPDVVCSKSFVVGFTLRMFFSSPFWGGVVISN